MNNITTFTKSEAPALVPRLLIHLYKIFRSILSFLSKIFLHRITKSLLMLLSFAVAYKLFKEFLKDLKKKWWPK